MLVIPGRQASKSSSKVAAKAPKKESGQAAAKVPASAARSYRVKGGDTLYGIAKRTGTTVDSLMAANSLESPEIKAGDRLVIPPRSR